MNMGISTLTDKHTEWEQVIEQYEKVGVVINTRLFSKIEQEKAYRRTLATLRDLFKDDPDMDRVMMNLAMKKVADLYGFAYDDNWLGDVQ